VCGSVKFCSAYSAFNPSRESGEILKGQTIRHPNSQIVEAGAVVFYFQGFNKELVPTKPLFRLASVQAAVMRPASLKFPNYLVSFGAQSITPVPSGHDGHILPGEIILTTLPAWNIWKAVKI
jgi:hypothetical protein